jgi:hypothetical protein
VELEGDVHVIVKEVASSLQIRQDGETLEKKTIGPSHPLDFKGLGTAVEMPGSDGPGGEVAKVHRRRFHDD